MFTATDCYNCGSGEVFLKRKDASKVGLYCSNCGRWLKWVGKKDIGVYQRRGYKVNPENYYPSHISPQPPNTGDTGVYCASLNSRSDTTTPKVVDYDNVVVKPSRGTPPIFAGMEVSEDSFTLDEPLPSTNSIRNRTSQYHQSEPESIRSSNPCPVCASGVLDSCDPSSDVTASIFDKVLFVRKKDNTAIYGSYKISFCPHCGIKL